MKRFTDFKNLPIDCQQAALAIGNFDGVHQGHQGVIKEAGRIASANDVPWGVMTFEPHPRLFFKPDQAPFRLTPAESKFRAIQDLGADFLISLAFDRDLAVMSPEDFISQVLVDNLSVFHVVCGYDFTFGRRAQGNCALLLHMGMTAGFGMTAVGAIDDETGEAYSSTRVRDALRQGDTALAAAILGRPFEIFGQVQHGDERGRTIGFPTANIHLGEYMEPKRGVYAVRVGMETASGMAWHDGVANIGIRPTFDKTEPVLEAYIFDFEQDIYDQDIHVQLMGFVRPEQKFDGLEALVSQIKADCETARNLLK